MPVWTAETVIALAPDAASVSAGRGLADAGKWASAGASEAAAWGEAKGSGSKPYQVTVDLGDGASKCSCPSRKFPCKHALGLLLRIAKGDVTPGAPPAWATDWLEKRGQKTAAPKATAAAPSAKTVEKRWDTVLKGLDECEAFLRDAVENGLLSTAAARTWDGMAARMEDAQAPGVARRLRDVGSKVGIDNVRAAADLGSLALLVEAARRVDDLGDLAHDVRVAVGIPTRKEEAVETVEDDWDVLGAATETDGRLTIARSWLKGRRSGRWVLFLGFSTPGSPPPKRLLPGFAFAGEANFFPSVWPLRAHLETLPATAFAPQAGSTWTEALETQADALAKTPWIERFPVQLRGARLGAEAVVDADGLGVASRMGEKARGRLLARTGNAPCEIFGELENGSFTPLGAWGTWGVLTL